MSEKKRSQLITHEDYWAIWIGAALIIIGMLLYIPGPPDETADFDKLNEKMAKEASIAGDSLKTIGWYEILFEKEAIKGSSEPVGKFLKNLLSKPHKWNSNPIHSFVMSDDAADEKAASLSARLIKARDLEFLTKSKALKSQEAAMNAGFRDYDLNRQARNDIDRWIMAREELKTVEKKIPKRGYNQIIYLFFLAIILAGLFGIGMMAMQHNFIKFFAGFFFIFLIATIAYFIAANQTMSELGLGYAIWAILLGLIISNTVGTPKLVKSAVQTEYFIKTGLVLLGAEVLFEKILQIGLPGLLVAWVVTPVVIISSFTFGRRVLKGISNELNITMSSAVSVCGVSAAIATAAACKAKKEELTLAVGLSLIFTAIMMVLMPAFIKLTNMGEILGGAWMGGVIDSTGAVAAAGAFLGPKALYVAATIKMIQNILIGLVAFVVAIYWAVKIENKDSGTNTSAMEIWYRFPKFVIGFAAASIVASIVSASLGSDMAYTVFDNGVIRGFTKGLRGWMFCLAFTSIGLSTNFRELKEHFKGGKPFWLYIFGQTFNLLLTLLIAWLAFYILFPGITKLI